jgi:MFS family permease
VKLRGNQWGVALAIGLSRIAFGFQLQTIASLGPDLTRAYGLDFAALGTLVGIYMAAGVVVALPTGFAARRFGDYNLAVAGFILMVLGSVVAGLGSVEVIMAGRLMSGSGSVILTVLQSKIIADRFRGPNFTHVMGAIVGSFPIGLGLAQVVLPGLAAAMGVQIAFIAGACVAGLAFLLLLLCWTEVAAAPARSAAWPSRHEIWLVAITGLIWTAYNAGYQNYLAFLPSLMAGRGHSQALIGAAMSLATWGNLPAILLGGVFATRFGGGKVFMVGTLATFAGVIGPAFADWPLVWTALFGTIGSLHGGLIIEMGTLSAKPQNRAVAMGIFYTTYYAGASVIPALCGRAADWAGDPVGALVCAALLSLAAIPLYIWRRRMV